MGWEYTVFQNKNQRGLRMELWIQSLASMLEDT